MSKIKKISRVLVQPANKFFLRIHVNLFNKKNDGREENFHNHFKANNGQEYLTLDLQSFLTLELRDGDWAMDKSIMINQLNIYQIIKGFEKSLEGIYNGGVFAVNKKGDPVIFKDKQEEHTVRLYHLGNNNRLVITPAIIYDDDDTTYEGVILHINKTENYVEMPMNAFEALYYALKKADLFVYSQALINYYVATMQKKMDDSNTQSAPKRTPKRHPLSVVNPKEAEKVKSNISPSQTSKEFFGI
jgi:hypothetical protein